MEGRAVVSNRIISKGAIDAKELIFVPAPIQTSGKSFIHRVWPPAVIILSLAVTTAWTAILGYGLLSIIWLSI
jgi:hypothetical protein